jgi:uncharacterized lipoprotein YddW (UPF0748 family)
MRNPMRATTHDVPRAEGRPSARRVWALAALLALAVPRAFAGDVVAAGGDSLAFAKRDSVPVSGADSLAASRRDSVPADTVHRDVEYLWVLRDALVDPAEVPRIVARAKEMKVRGLLVQVVGRGDAWYRSDLLPAPEALADRTRDPLGELLPLAHEAGLEVHAWMNCCLVWSGPRPPRDPRHVLRQHPDWVARLQGGRPMSHLTARAIARLRVEGVFLSPGNPGVRHWLAAIAAELAHRYPVDGIHLDYIRQPGVALAFDPSTRAAFALAHGADPDPALPSAPFHRLPANQRAAMDSAWTAFQREQVTEIVREVRDSIAAIRPGLPLSAAVLADTLAALRSNRQSWVAWLREGLLDRAFAMCYAPEVQKVMSQLTAMSNGGSRARIVPGIAVYNTPLSTAATKIKGARALGFAEVALYSYDSLWGREGQWPRLHAFLNGPASLEVHP